MEEFGRVARMMMDSARNKAESATTPTCMAAMTQSRAKTMRFYFALLRSSFGPLMSHDQCRSGLALISNLLTLRPRLSLCFFGSDRGQAIDACLPHESTYVRSLRESKAIHTATMYLCTALHTRYRKPCFHPQIFLTPPRNFLSHQKKDQSSQS